MSAASQPKRDDCQHLGGIRQFTEAGPVHHCAVLGSVRLEECTGCEDYQSTLNRGDCRHRGAALREDVNNLCGARGKPATVFSCSKHGECSIGRYCNVQTVRTCVTCPDHETAETIKQWIEPPPVEFTRHNPRLIVTVAIGGQFARLLQITGPLFRAYAERCEADFIALTDKTQGWWGLEKFRVKALAEAYERTAFIDADCLIRPTCRNLFDLVPAGTVGIHDDYRPDRLERFTREWALFCVSQGEQRPFMQRMLNTGVVVCDRKTANIWTPPAKAVPGNHCDEQFQVDLNIERLGRQVTNLPQSLNHQHWMEDWADGLPTAEIVHLANCQIGRVELAKRLAVELCGTSTETPK